MNIESLLLVVSILLPLSTLLYHSYAGTPEFISGVFQSFMVGGSGMVLIKHLVEDTQMTNSMPPVYVYILGCIGLSLFTYRAFIYSNKFDRKYPEDTVKLWEDPETGYIRAMIKIGSDNIDRTNAFVVEIHGVKQKWFAVYEDKNQFSNDLLTTSNEPTKCWHCGQVKDDIRLRGIRLSPYAMKNNILDSRNESIGIGEASICYDCSMDLVKELNSSTDLNIDSADLVAAGI